jgi:hypothetical protein
MIVSFGYRLAAPVLAVRRAAFRRSAHDREPVAIFIGEVLPHYAADIDDDTVRILLNELASEIGAILEQQESTSHIVIGHGR